MEREKLRLLRREPFEPFRALLAGLSRLHRAPFDRILFASCFDPRDGRIPMIASLF